MIIQLNTDHNIQGDERLQTYVNDLITSELGRFSDRVSRMEVFLKDENSHKPGINDKHCSIEARIEGRKPLAASDQGDTVDLALQGAVEKLKHVLDSTLEQLRDSHRG